MGAGEVCFNDGFASVETAPIDVSRGSFQVSIYLDSNSIEVFADEGNTVISDTVFSTGSLTSLTFFATGGNAVVEQLSITGRS
jgi:fructan beta-fructosidase